MSVNGVPIFAKGSNYIPSNILPEKSYNTNTLQYLIETAKISHMNILRIWGGGRYESDEFYEVNSLEIFIIYRILYIYIFKHLLIKLINLRYLVINITYKLS